jgi:hypothetical protein
MSRKQHNDKGKSWFEGGQEGREHEQQVARGNHAGWNRRKMKQKQWGHQPNRNPGFATATQE